MKSMMDLFNNESHRMNIFEKHIKIIGISWAFLFLASCAGTTKYQSYPSLDPNTTPTALVHIVRSDSPFGSAITAPVYIDRYLIGRLGPGGHISTRVPVGDVFLASTTAGILIKTEIGKSYFYEVTMPVQMWLTSPDFNIKEITRIQSKEIIGYDLDSGIKK